MQRAPSVRPVSLDVIPQSIPRELREIDRWVCWRYELRGGKWTKPPITVRGKPASSTDAATWATFADAYQAYVTNGWDGVGLALDGSGDLVGIDIDHEDAPDQVAALHTYAERSPSGSGWRAFALAKVPEDARRRAGQVEVYTHGRYLTCTGHQLQGSPCEVARCDDAVIELLRRHGMLPNEPREGWDALGLADDDITQRLFAIKDGKWRALWDGHWEEYGYRSRSEGVAALLMELVFCARHDEKAVRDAFLRSGMMHSGMLEKRGATDKLGYEIAGACKRQTSDWRENVEAAPGEEWARALAKKRDGALEATADNLALILANDLRWKDCLGYDELAQCTMWTGSPPPVAGLKTPSGRFADEHVTWMAKACRCMHHAQWSKDSIFDAVLLVARERPYNPVVRYLEALVWDGRARVDTWAETYLGAKDRHAGARLWLISAVARAFSPGCQADSLIVLEGAQGGGKSTVCRILAGPWYQGTLGDISNNKGPESLRGAWIVEVAEMDAVRRKDEASKKSFFSQVSDDYRPAYGREVRQYKRRCVFIGTTNESNWHHDASGGRRFWPIACGRIDTELLARDRDQLWAEAVVMYKRGERHYPNAADAQILAESIAQREPLEPWRAKIEARLAIASAVTIDEIHDLLEIPMERRNRTTAMRIKDALTRLGCVEEKPHRGPRTWSMRGAGKGGDDDGGGGGGDDGGQTI